MTKKLSWTKNQELTQEKMEIARLILEDMRSGKLVLDAIRHHPGQEGHLSKAVLVAAYNQLVESGEWQPDPGLQKRIRMKPVRTLSGVTTVTVLTKPYPCPAHCIFCPDDARMPKRMRPGSPASTCCGC